MIFGVSANIRKDLPPNKGSEHCCCGDLLGGIQICEDVAAVAATITTFTTTTTTTSNTIELCRIKVIFSFLS